MTDPDTQSVDAPIGGIDYAITDLSGWESDPAGTSVPSISTIPGPEHDHMVDDPGPAVPRVEPDQDEIGVNQRRRRRFFRGGSERTDSGVRAEPPLTQRSRGLALKKLTLHEAHQFFLKRWWNRLFKKTPTANLFFVSIALDGSGTEPFVWPLSQDTASQAAIKVRVGETYKWTLGAGAPIFGPKVIEGGLAVSILVVDSKDAVKNWGKALSTISESLSAKNDLMSSIKGLAHPGAFTVQAASEVIGKAAGVVGDVLKVKPDNRVGAYVGVFPSTGSWKGKLVQKQRGASITLAEVVD